MLDLQCAAERRVYFTAFHFQGPVGVNLSAAHHSSLILDKLMMVLICSILSNCLACFLMLQPLLVVCERSFSETVTQRSKNRASMCEYLCSLS